MVMDRKNRLDLDADDDGIADIIAEAGGIDIDNNGRAIPNVDTDADGWADDLDDENGGTALPVADYDNDGLKNYLDIDSDNDGITDNVEGQTQLFGIVAPQNQILMVMVGMINTILISNCLSNKELVGNPDYLDDDSDGDGIPGGLKDSTSQ